MIVSFRASVKGSFKICMEDTLFLCALEKTKCNVAYFRNPFLGVIIVHLVGTVTISVLEVTELGDFPESLAINSCS